MSGTGEEGHGKGAEFAFRQPGGSTENGPGDACGPGAASDGYGPLRRLRRGPLPGNWFGMGRRADAKRRGGRGVPAGITRALRRDGRGREGRAGA